MAALPLQKDPQEPDDDVPDGTIGFLDHLEELRSRIIRSGIALAASVIEQASRRHRSPSGSLALRADRNRR